MQQNGAENLAAVKPAEPQWYRAYFLAMVERDRGKALLEIRKARTAILERTRELRYMTRPNPREIQDLVNALTYLGILLSHIGAETGDLLWD